MFVGGLDERATKRDVEDFFRGTGNITTVWVARQPPGFAFAEFEDPRDAEDAARDLNGKEIRGRPVRVEVSHGRGKSRGPNDAGRDETCFECGRRGHFARNCLEVTSWNGLARVCFLSLRSF